MPTIVYSQTWDVDLGSPDGFDQATRSTTTKRTGAGALRVKPIGATGYWEKNAVGGAQTIIVMQAYVNFASFPIADDPEIFCSFAAGEGAVGIGYDLSDNKFHCNANGAAHTSGGPVLALGTWYKLDVKINVSGATITVDGKVNDVDLPQCTDGGGPYSLAQYKIGNGTTNATMDMYADDFQVSHLALDYPISTGVTVPSAPLSLIGTAGNNQVALTWTAPSSNGGSAITGYRVYRSTTTNTETLLASPAGTNTAYTDATAVNGTTYFYRVSAYNAIGDGSWGNEVSVTPVSSSTVPSSPLSPIATPGNNQIALTWSAPSSDGGSALTGYKIYRGTSPGTETLLAPSSTIYPSNSLFPSDTAPGGLGTGTSYTDLTAVNGTNYCYKISATNAVGEGALSSEVCATPSSPATVPTAPLSLVATPGVSQNTLSWSAPASNGGSVITAYLIYRSTTPGTETLYASPAGVATAYTDVGATIGQIYYYKVAAVNAIGTSPLSSEASATSTAAPASPTRTFKRFYGPALLGNTATTLYTCPASTTAVVQHVHVSNPTASTVDFTLSIGTNAAGTRLWDGFPIPVDDVLDHYQNFSLSAGEILQGVAGVAGLLNLTIDGYETTP